MRRIHNNVSGISADARVTVRRHTVPRRNEPDPAGDNETLGSLDFLNKFPFSSNYV